MIYITGDCHGDFKRFSTSIFPEQREMTKDDCVIICGDFGGVWAKRDSTYYKNQEHWLDWLESKPFTTVFCCGNHENFEELYSYPIMEWNGGKVHAIRPSVLHLMRGEIFTIEGKRFFAFGGASSHDVQDGILDLEDPEWRQKAKMLDKEGKFMYRIKGLSWWPQELPNKEEMNNGFENLEKYNYEVDYIVTHTPPASIISLMGHGLYEQDILTKYLEEVRCKTKYTNWVSGHLHINTAVNDKDLVLYEQIVRMV